MDRRKLLVGGAALIGAASLPRTYAQAQSAPEKIRIGYAISISGPLGAGAENTTISQYKLWNKVVNDAGGIALKKYNKKVPVEMVAYDDRGQPDELLKLLDRLILQDKVDLILSPYATHMNMAAAPIVNKYEQPVIFTTAGSAKIYELAKSWPYAFWSIVQPNEGTLPLVEMCAALKKEGKIRGRVAAVYVAQQSMVEMHAAFVGAATKAGLDVVLSKSYPFNTSDLQPLVREVMAADPDAFIAFSYPGDTFLLTEQMQTVGFDPQIYYAAIGSAFAAFKGKYGENVEGILTYDGINRDAPGFAEYNKAHIEILKRPAQVASTGVFGCLQVLQQSVEKVGEIDRKKIRDQIANGKFETVWGTIEFKDQRNQHPWAVGQWQNGQVVGVFPTRLAGAKPVIFPKPRWKKQ